MIVFSRAGIRRLFVACLMALAVLASPALARDPLLMPGKKTLYQRVLTRPGVPMTREAGVDGALATLPPFEIFYVYGAKHVGDKDYIEVGRSLQGGPEGWMAKDDTIAWKQSIVLGFNNPVDRDRALIFRTREELEATLSQEDVAARLDQLRHDAVSGQLQPQAPVVSIEPAEHIDITSEFYVLPILESQSVRLPTNIRAQILRIASVPKERGRASPERSREDALRDFRIGVTFVIDTTKSMQPYIDEVRNAITQLRDSIAGSPEADRFRFGLIAFRDNLEEAPGLEYVTRTVLPLDEQSTAERFVQSIGDLKAARISSRGFDEDSLAGIQAAVDGLNWEPFGGRLIILVTDAGPRPPGAGSAAGDLGPAELQTILQQKNIALMTLHLKSEAGRFDHETAETAYRTLSQFGGATNYFPIANADPAAFGQQVLALATRLQGVVSDAIAGRMAEGQSNPDDISASAGLIGRAMQLAYLGSAENVQAPDVFEGWVTDVDPLRRGIFPVSPYFLMSRNELAGLRDVVQKAIDLGSGSTQEGTSDQFFTRLREAVALMGVRPEAVQDAGTLGDLLGEYLEDLPYRSEIINLTQEDWRDLSPIAERELIDTLRSKVVALEKLHNDQNRWHALSPDAPAGEYVTTVPLSLMP